MAIDIIQYFTLLNTTFFFSPATHLGDSKLTILIINISLFIIRLHFPVKKHVSDGFINIQQ